MPRPSDVNIVVQDRLETALFHISVHLGYGPVVTDFELLISDVAATVSMSDKMIRLVLVFFLMVADSGGYARRHLGRAYFGDAIAESSAFPAGDRDPCIGQENAVGAENLTELALADITGIDAVVVDDGAQAGTAEGELGMRIIAVYIIGMEGCRQGILPVIGQTQQCGEGYSPHAAQQSALLGVETIGPYAFVPQQMKRLVLVCVVSFLKNGHIIDAAFMQITVLIDIDRIDFYADILCTGVSDEKLSAMPSVTSSLLSDVKSIISNSCLCCRQ